MKTPEDIMSKGNCVVFNFSIDEVIEFIKIAQEDAIKCAIENATVKMIIIGQHEITNPDGTKSYYPEHGWSVNEQSILELLK